MTANRPPTTAPGTAPARAGLVLVTLIIVAAVANLPLAVANVALPDIVLNSGGGSGSFHVADDGGR